MRMTGSGRIALGLVLLMFLLAGWWIAERLPGLDPDPGPDAYLDAALREAGAVDDEARDDPGPALRGGGATTAARAQGDAPSPPPDGTPAGPRFVSVVDARGRPVPGAGIDWVFNGGVRTPRPDLDPYLDIREPMARTDEQGRIAVPSWMRMVNGGCVRVRQAGYLVDLVPFPRAKRDDVLVLQLQKAVPMSGTVLDPAGRPWPGLPVVVRHVARDVTVQRMTDAEGRWETLMVGGTVAIEVRGPAGGLATRTVDLPPGRPFAWTLDTPAEDVICGVLEAPGARAEEVFSLICTWSVEPVQEVVAGRGARQFVLDLRHGSPFRVQRPAGATHATLRIRRQRGTFPLRVIEGVRAGQTALRVRLEPAHLATATLRLRLAREEGWSGSAVLRGPGGEMDPRHVDFRSAAGDPGLAVVFEDVPAGAGYELALHPAPPSPSVAEIEAGNFRFQEELPPPTWSRRFSLAAGQDLDLGTIDPGK